MSFSLNLLGSIQNKEETMIHLIFKTGVYVSSPAFAMIYWWNNLRNVDHSKETESSHHKTWMNQSN